MRRLSDSIKRLSKNLGFGKKDETAIPLSSDALGESDVTLSGSEDGAEVGEDEVGMDLAKLQESESDSEIEDLRAEGDVVEEDDEDEDEEEDEEDVPLSDVEIDGDADVVPHQKTTVNNQKALKQSLKAIELPVAARANFYEHMSVTTAEPTILKDIYDDTERELAFYKQALAAADIARAQFRKLKIPFERPTDFFAEMVKSDEHMDRLKKKMIDEETAKRAAQEARKQRDLKKFGKKVQHAKLQERQKEKRETLDKIKSLKRKRGNDDITGDQFEVEIEDALSDKKKERDNRFRLGGSNSKRDAKNKKFGAGGKKRGLNRNTAESSADMSSFNNSKKPSRPGKRSRRHK